MADWFVPHSSTFPLFAVLSAMVMPVVLISACGSLAISTSNRLSRTIDRVRKVSERFGELMRTAGDDATLLEEREQYYRQLVLATRRARMLQRALSRLYLANSLFVATSLAIAATALLGDRFAVVPVTLGIGGALLLFHASALLTLESRLAIDMIGAEMTYVAKVGDRLAPETWRTPPPSSGFDLRRLRRRKTPP